MLSLDEFRAAFPEQSFSIARDTWRYRRTRPGAPALVMLPGCHGTADVYYKVAACLGNDLDVITLTPPQNDDLHSLVSGLAQFVDALHLQNIALYGSSLGGHIAQLFSIRYRERVRKLLIGNSFRDPGALQEKWPKPSEFRNLPAKELMAGVIAKTRAMSIRTAPEADLKATLLSLLDSEQSADDLKSRFLTGILSKALPRVPLADHNVILVDSDDDGIIPLQPRADLRSTYKSSPRFSIKGGGHFPFLLRGEHLSAIINRHAFAN